MDYIAHMEAETPLSNRNDLRLRLLEAGIEVFGRHGFEGASTRMLAKAAGVNLQAIPYHFGSKQGLYLAVAEHIGSRIEAHVGPAALKIRARLAAQPNGTPLPNDEARQLLTEMLETAARLMVSEESAAWARFIVSEQMEPTQAFERLYAKVMAPLLGTARQLVGALIAADPETEVVRLRTLATLGQVLILRVCHAAVMRQMDWEGISAREFDLIRTMVRDSIALLRPIGNEGGAS